MERLNQAYDGLFPTTTSFIVFWSYITLFVSQGLLVKTVKINGSNATILVLITEIVKLLICIIVYLLRSHGNIIGLVNDIKKNNRLLLLYLIPSFLYCLYNNLTYINLSLFDLTTYYCLMQFRTVLTAIIYQILFRRKLTLMQWLSLIILTFGCLVKELGLYSYVSSGGNNSTLIDNTNLSNTLESVANELEDVHQLHIFFKYFWSTSLLLLQIFCSCFAGVYNEFLLKDKSTANNADVILQNMFMYIDSIFCNLIAYTLAKNSSHDMINSSEEDTLITSQNNLLTSPLVIILILNNAFSGLVASFFLKSLNSILKTFAASLELFAIAFLAWVLFDDKVDILTIIALSLVTSATFLYSRNPVSTAPPGRFSESKEGFVLVPQNED